MTFEEMQAIIGQMLAVQRDLQDSQLKLLEQSKQTERSIRQLIVYSISTENNQLDLREDLQSLRRRVERLENQ